MATWSAGVQLYYTFSFPLFPFENEQGGEKTNRISVWDANQDFPAKESHLYYC